MIRDAQTDATDPLPRVMLPDGVATLTEFTSWSASNAGRFRALLLESGALLFRGFGFEHPAAFQEFTRIFAPTLRRYVGGASPRKRVHENVYTSTDASPRHRMSQHHEASYLASMPAVVASGHARVAISSSGVAPALSGFMKEDLERILDGEFSAFVDWLGHLREQAKANEPDADKRRALLREALDGFRLLGKVQYPKVWQEERARQTAAAPAAKTT